MENEMSAADFDRLRAFIREESGISLSSEKKTMLEIRLRRRLRSLNLCSYAEYSRYLFSPAGKDQEVVFLIDAVTTNKTDFFREPDHFEYMVSKALPSLHLQHRGVPKRTLAWSAGCSSGEEPYTLAMVLDEYARIHPGFRYSILATDICTAVLEKAARGIFKADSVRPVPVNLRSKYLMRSRDPTSDTVRVVPELRAKIDFRRLNFLEPDWQISESPEIIFCRNVIIYFDRSTQVRLLERFTRQLAPGGYFFAGHSESLQSMDLPLTMAGPAVYRKHA